MNSKPIKVSSINGKNVYVTFTHAPDYRLLADITAEGTPGSIHMARNSSNDWVLLGDTVDRNILFVGTTPHSVLIDLEQTYQKYTMDQIVEVEDVQSSKWKKTKTQPVE